ncbi:MAG: penicillin-binding protein 1B [Desulfobacterales bacterium]|nr:penicillin-binding protein 1B [Desulfobacterales bacterium]
MSVIKFISKYKFRIIILVLLSGILISGILFTFYIRYYSQIVVNRFAGKRWELPARIYSRPLELYPGMKLDPEAFAEELRLMQYREEEQIDAAGSFTRSDNIFELFTRSFTPEDGEEPSKKIRVVIKSGMIRTIKNLKTGRFPDLVRLDPAHIGSFYPTHNEDRILVRLKDVSPLLVQTMLGVEDRDYYKHHGVSPLAILRAMITNIRKLHTVQGGSTLTQQLVKNFFLTDEQTYKRKTVEAFMALALEKNYDKDEILEAYLNEVYLGQDGRRAIHGFGLGSMFYFGRSLNDLRHHEIALLVGLLKGPSYYDPRKNQERALKRRNTVLKVMEELKLIRTEEANKASLAPLGVIDDFRHGTTKFPAFMDLIKRHLLQEYKEEDLRSEGLKIFTSFDPLVQFAMEKAVSSHMDAIETLRKLPKGEVEVSAVVISTGGDEVLAITGARNPRFHGFNRALVAKRPIGSLVKPAIYLTALQDPDNYTLMTLLDDSPLRIKDSNNRTWSPRNYDLQYHGYVPLYHSLTHSYNVATVRLGKAIGLDKVSETIKKLGYTKKIKTYPSLLLGTMEMSTLEVAQMYQPLTSGGFFSPIRAIRRVYKPSRKEPLQRYEVTVQEHFDPGPVYLLNKILQEVVVQGTAKSLKGKLRELAVAGKTGTTNDLRDSWFAGFTGNRLAVVWLGRDDNKATGLTGSTGALQIWGKIMENIRNDPLELPHPESVEWAVIDPETGKRTEDVCENAIAIPFITGSAPTEMISCKEQEPEGDFEPPPEESSFIRWLREKF